jgi:hypothetical protein
MLYAHEQIVTIGKNAAFYNRFELAAVLCSTGTGAATPVGNI